MYGLSETSQVTEVIEKQDKDTAIRYTVRQEIINLKALRDEKVSIEAEVEPGEAELIIEGKAIHVYYSKTAKNREDRIKEIDTILEKVNNGSHNHSPTN